MNEGNRDAEGRIFVACLVHYLCPAGVSPGRNPAKPYHSMWDFNDGAIIVGLIP